MTRKGDTRLDIELAGRLCRDDMQAVLDELVGKSGGIEHGRMMYRVGDLELPTLGAMAVELSRIPEMFRWLRRFDRAAVIVDRSWIRTVSEIEGALIPGLAIKAFDVDEQTAAEAWLDKD